MTSFRQDLAVTKRASWTRAGRPLSSSFVNANGIIATTTHASRISHPALCPARQHKRQRAFSASCTTVDYHCQPTNTTFSSAQVRFRRWPSQDFAVAPVIKLCGIVRHSISGHQGRALQKHYVDFQTRNRLSCLSRANFHFSRDTEGRPSWLPHKPRNSLESGRWHLALNSRP